MNLPIGRVAKTLNVSSQILVKWEQKGLIPKAKRRLQTKVRFWSVSEVDKIHELLSDGVIRR